MGKAIAKARLTDCEAKTYAAIREAAEAGKVCPTNLDLEMLTGYNSSSMGPAIIRRLEEKELIVVKRYQRFRQVKVVETGKWTAPNPARLPKPHVPRGAKRNYPTDVKPYKRA